jgi:hypothetical protein
MSSVSGPSKFDQAMPISSVTAAAPFLPLTTEKMIEIAEAIQTVSANLFKTSSDELVKLIDQGKQMLPELYTGEPPLAGPLSNLTEKTKTASANFLGFKHIVENLSLLVQMLKHYQTIEVASKKLSDVVATLEENTNSSNLNKNTFSQITELAESIPKLLEFLDQNCSVQSVENLKNKLQRLDQLNLFGNFLSQIKRTKTEIEGSQTKLASLMKDLTAQSESTSAAAATPTPIASASGGVRTTDPAS